MNTKLALRARTQVQQTIQNATVPTSNGTSSAFLDAYDEFIVNTVGPTWEMYVGVNRSVPLLCNIRGCSRVDT